MNKPLVIYHDNCVDGFASAFAAWLKLGDDAEYFPCNYSKYRFVYDGPISGKYHLVYNDKSTVISDREIYIVDFSFPRMTLEQMGRYAKMVTVLDHHKTTQDDLTHAIDEAAFGIRALNLEFTDPEKFNIIFDMSKAGCWLTWEYFHADQGMPLVLYLVGLRDIWQHKGTVNERKAEAANLALATAKPWSFQQWQEIANNDIFLTMLADGIAILEYFNQRVSEACEFAIAAPPFMIVNAPYFMASELGNKLAEANPTQIAVIWSMAKDGSIMCSLRSVGDVDCTIVAKAFGGGGHKNAAGCSFRNIGVFASNFGISV